ncbi:hypothetical protein [Niallia sp. Krafla_26]|uniref:hypothetical protein n=1 Tax=Niallia sp. Krafla_26 TaxID=3064703 RepID=UPI003D17FC9D
MKLIHLDTDAQTEIGNAEFNFYNLVQYEDWSDVLDTADGDSDEDYEVMNILSNKLNDEEPFGKLVILKRIIIEENFRNFGFGSIAIKEFIEYWGIVGVDFIALKPAPTDHELRTY